MWPFGLASMLRVCNWEGKAEKGLGSEVEFGEGKQCVPCSREPRVSADSTLDTGA